jgi:hypothetical protein
MTDLLQRVLPTVQKPARYTGGEFNEIKKDPDSIRVNIAFCFPDTYEIGMSNLGMRILYGVMNQMDGVWCQRVFAPWGDMEEAAAVAGVDVTTKAFWMESLDLLCEQIDEFMALTEKK